MVSMVLVLMKVGPILGNGYGNIKGNIMPPSGKWNVNRVTLNFWY